MSVSPRQDRMPKFARHVLPDRTGLAPNLYYEVICVYVSQQVEVAQLLSQIVKNLYIKTDGSRGLV